MTTLFTGDLAIIGFNFDNPDELKFVLLEDISSGTQINFTDKGWQTNNNFRSSEGIYIWTADQDYQAGTVIQTLTSGVAFSSSGDQIIAYQEDEDSNPRLIYALNSEGNQTWQNDATSSNTSALPDGLIEGETAIALAEIDNAVYDGKTTGTKTELLTEISNPTNWSGSNSQRQNFEQIPTFTIINNPPQVNIIDRQFHIKTATELTITGINITPLEASYQNITVTLQVNQGSLSVNTGIEQGLSADNVLNNQTSDVTIIGNLSTLNTTLSNPLGLIYSSNQSFNGVDNLTININQENSTSSIALNVISHATQGQDLLIGDASNNYLHGGDGDDEIQGKIGSDRLIGGTGDDTLIGGIGNDVYIVDSEGDLVTENPAEGIDQVVSSVNWELSDYVENLTLKDTQNLNGIGNNLDNRLIGNEGNNVLNGQEANDLLNGKGGNDTLIGGLGDDTYVLESNDDILLEEENQGIDRVIASISWQLGSNIENLTLKGNDPLNGIGNSQNNRIVGNAGNNSLDGAQGNDILAGKDGEDQLIGGTGNDTLRGDSGEDTLIGVNPNDALAGNSEIDQLIGGIDRDIFVLGDENQAYYQDDVSDNQGQGDYALIRDFEPGVDIIQLHGSFEDYLLAASPFRAINGQGIFGNRDGQMELIGVVKDTFDLNLSGDYFSLVTN